MSRDRGSIASTSTRSVCAINGKHRANLKVRPPVRRVGTVSTRPLTKVSSLTMSAARQCEENPVPDSLLQQDRQNWRQADDLSRSRWCVKNGKRRLEREVEAIPADGLSAARAEPATAKLHSGGWNNSPGDTKHSRVKTLLRHPIPARSQRADQAFKSRDHALSCSVASHA